MNNLYLIHSAKGTSWEKKDHKYTKKIQGTDGKWYYVYGEVGADVDADQQKKNREEWDSYDELADELYSKGKDKKYTNGGYALPDDSGTYDYKVYPNETLTPKRAAYVAKRRRNYIEKHVD